MSAEIWRQVPGARHAVSNHGRVKALGGWRRVLSQQLDGKGYPRVTLYIDTAEVRRYVHQLVAEAFLGPRPDPQAVVRHLDGEPLNNHVDNLRWGTPAENSQDTVRHGRHVQARKTHCPQGHSYDATNTRSSAGGRQCRRCNAAAAARYKARQKEGTR